MGRPFLPGQSGNPGGRPKGYVEVRELAREHTAEAIEKLVAVMRKGESEQAQILAANSLLDRGWGRPTQPIAGDPEGPPIIHEHQAAIIAELHRLVAARRVADGDGGDDCRANGGAPLRMEWSEGSGRTDPTAG
jgi:hypothetical protein